MSRKQPILTQVREVGSDSVLEEMMVARGEGSAEHVGVARGPKFGVLQRLDQDGRPHVLLCAGEDPVAAQSTVALKASDAGRRVLVLFENNDSDLPIIVGVLGGMHEGAVESGPPVEVTIDGRRLTLHAERELVLQCGEASITLTRTGKVVVRGTALVSRSSGVNRIKGASVQIN